MTTTNSLEATEAECAAGRTAPRVSLADIEANIAARFTFIATDAICSMENLRDQDGDWPPAMESAHPRVEGISLDVLTICLLQLQNGFTIIGKSPPASAANFDRELGAKLAYQDAVRQVWPLMGYELRERLHRQDQAEKFERMDAEMLPAFAHQAPIPQVDTPDGMTRFVGTKIIDARPMCRGEYLEFRGWELPVDEDPADDGYLVHYTDGGKPNVPGLPGYVSWTPKEQFDQAYRPL